ncbi:hypothetical protein Trydic_g21248 [Trypoxylus dichotomus]
MKMPDGWAAYEAPTRERRGGGGVRNGIDHIITDEGLTARDMLAAGVQLLALCGEYITAKEPGTYDLRLRYA